MDFRNREETGGKTGENKSRTSMLPDDADLHPVFYLYTRILQQNCSYETMKAALKSCFFTFRTQTKLKNPLSQLMFVYIQSPTVKLKDL